jgi:hypothetical protein
MAQEVNIPRIPGVRGISALWARYMRLSLLLSGPRDLREVEVVGKEIAEVVVVREEIAQVVSLSMIFTEMELLCLEAAGPAYILLIISLIHTTTLINLLICPSGRMSGMTTIIIMLL